MALLPIYDWLGIDDDLTRRQQWSINLVGLATVLAVGHLLGFVDLGGVGADVLFNLPGFQQVFVVAIAAAAVAVIWITITERTISDIAWIVAAATGGFFLVDLFYVHPHVFDNIPSLLYWLAKPIWVGVPMFVAAFWIMDRTDFPRPLTYTIAGLAGIVSLQLYYTAVPIPVVGGESIQVGLKGNLTTGLGVHGGALLLALAVIVIAIEGRRLYAD